MEEKKMDVEQMEPESEERMEKAAQLSARKILIEQDGAYVYQTLEDYLPGVILCQIETEMESEALKCQAVIARTYICRVMGERESIEAGELNLAYPGKFSGDILANFGRRDTAVAALERCEQAVRDTKGVVITYEDRWILPLFHKSSAGRTRTGDEEFPYLQAAESKWDVESEGCFTEFSWSASEFEQKICLASGEGDFVNRIGTENLASQMQIVKKDDSGYVIQMKIGAKIYSGEEIQAALELPSCCFSIFISQGNVCARVMGNGHGYGLSQVGANAMAKAGWGYEDILHYYYKNISLVSE